MDIKEIQNLIKFVAKSGAHEVKLEMEDFKITIKTAADQIVPEQQTIVQHLPATAPAVAAAPAPAPASSTNEAKADAPADAATNHLITIKSPIIGTFYRKPSPDKPNFVEVGSTLAQGDVLCVIEAMKLFNEIESEHSGKIVKILVDDASPVEFDQPLFLIDPS
ncbi:MAG: acetyl-CoA carboxylase biotin carboxyl carrier protein [Bacteroidetes bacterium]|nr:acetyl-CoA carboxylase biotin carboxyl carrier protein [Bacteroidota bacterium]MDA0938273.1 acetyl-CoA carboxylase biotin carboxyl carrier protein [Bacteroidota bacterium]MDA1344612.1 acetyl-CoA carboxylase biotin carboxyl carrier protein [Bacteroidota bacterium]